MLLYVKHYAQMCNRLWAFIPALAYALHKQQKLNVFFAKQSYLDLFPHLKRCHQVRFLCSHNRPTPAPLEWRLALWSEKRHLEIATDLRKAHKTKCFSFIDGWQHRSDISFIVEQKSKIVELFKPADDVIHRVNSYFENYDGITIGVHVRRGDYKEYLDGKYYYADSVYAQVLEQLRSLFGEEGQKVRFLICSNEPFNVSTTQNDTFFINDADAITDLYALSRCDYIVGPPSSFSQWASFYGDVPLCQLFNANPSFTKESFSPIVRMDTFANGLQILMNEDKQAFYLG